MYRVTLTKFGVNYRSSNGRGSFEVKVASDAVKVSDLVIASTRQGLDLFRESKMYVKDQN